MDQQCTWYDRQCAAEVTGSCCTARLRKNAIPQYIRALDRRLERYHVSGRDRFASTARGGVTGSSNSSYSLYSAIVLLLEVVLEV